MGKLPEQQNSLGQRHFRHAQHAYAATATLMALFGCHHSRLAGIGLSLFALAIFIGSIHLAWHYALDSYAGALGAWLIWGLVGRWQDELRGCKTTPEVKV